MYQTEPEPGLIGRSVFQPRGKVLGGSSSINGLLYVRGQHEDYDRWRQRGNIGWGYDDVLPYFKKSEDQTRGDDDFHGAGGPLPVSDWRHTDPLSAAFVDAAEQVGIPRNPDFNGATQEGAGFFQTTTRGGRRASTAVAYLVDRRKPAAICMSRRRRSRRKSVRGTPRRCGDLSRRRRRAHGAGPQGNCPSGEKRIQLAAAIATILASARLTLLRRQCGRSCSDVPGVGHDLQDHMQVRVVMRCSQAITLNDIVNSPFRKVMAGLRYALSRSGPLTIAAGTSGAFFKTNPRLASPDIQIHFLPFSTDKMGEKLHSFSGFTASVCQLRPESRGSLRIKSADPAAPPEIRINYLATEVDRNANVEGLKILRRILHAPALAPYVVEEVDPGDKIVSDEALLAYCRARGSTIYHPTSTCRMGNDPLAVVDQQLRVRGIDGLRVVDASVMPDLVSGNTNAPVIMIAEKVSDMILQDAR